MEFKKLFLEKIADDKTLAMLLKELGNLKIGDKERVKYFSQIFTHLLKRFPTNVQLHNHITKDYYTTSLSTNISVSFKRDAKNTLALNFVEAPDVEKYLHYIGFIEGIDDLKDSKETGKKIQASSSIRGKTLSIWKALPSL